MANSKRYTTLKARLYPNAAQAELFEKTFGYPKLKRKKDDRDSFTACNHEFTSSPTIYITKDGLRMTKAGIIPAKFPRCPPGTAGS